MLALLRQALSLPNDERAYVPAELLATLGDTAFEDPAVLRDVWSRELQRQAERVLSGESDGEDWNDLRQRLTDEFAGGCAVGSPKLTSDEHHTRRRLS